MAAVPEKEMKVVTILKEIIKPSSPTPSHLRNFNLSVLDRFQPTNLYTPLLLFYTSGSDSDKISTGDKSHQLRKSLSETLTRFYPVAGRLNAGFTAVDCNDGGACYSEATISCSLSDVLTDVRLDQIRRLFVPDRSDESWGSDAKALLFAQVTFFECGGMAVVTLLSHVIADGAACFAFTKAWASSAGGRPDAVVPDFSASSLFPINGAHQVWALPDPVKCVSRRFVFDASKIKTLKLRAVGNVVQQPPTSVEVVSALLWKCSAKAVAASRSKLGSSSPRRSILSWTINIRSKLVPPMSKYSLGNIIVSLLIKSGKNPEKDELDGFVCQVKEHIQEFKKGFVKQLQEEENVNQVVVDWYRKNREETFKLGGDTDFYYHSSVCRFGLYDVDFGWGRPTWAVILQGFSAPTMAMLTDTFDGKGIEATVDLLEEEIFFLEHDPEILEFASVNPSPLHQQKNTLTKQL